MSEEPGLPWSCRILWAFINSMLPLSLFILRHSSYTIPLCLRIWKHSILSVSLRSVYIYGSTNIFFPFQRFLELLVSLKVQMKPIIVKGKCLSVGESGFALATVFHSLPGGCSCCMPGKNPSVHIFHQQNTGNMLWEKKQIWGGEKLLA